MKRFSDFLKLYRFFLPKEYNDGKPIEPERFDEFTEELKEKFDGVTFVPSIDSPLIQGIWKSKKTQITYKDKISMIELFVGDTLEIQDWIREFKEKIEKELEQEKIFVLVQNAEVL